MNISPRQLRIFVVLAESLSFHKAAGQLHITQPTLSKLVRSLEEQVGAPLFERSTRHVQLTRDGQALVNIARQTLSNYQDGLNVFERIVRHRNQRVAIAALPTLAATLLPRLVADLQQTVPDAHLQVYDVISDEATALLHARKVDMILTAVENTQVGLRCTRLFAEPFVLVHRPGAAIPVTQWNTAALSQMPIISMPHGTSTRALADAFFLRDGRTFQPLFALRDLNTIARFVQAGCGIALLPLSAAEPFLGDTLRITHLQGAPERMIGIFTLRNESLSPLAQQVMRALQAIGSDRSAAPSSSDQPPALI